MAQQTIKEGSYVKKHMPRLAYGAILLLCLLGMLTTLLAFSINHPSHKAHAQAPNNGNMPVGLNVDINEQSLNDLMANDPRFQAVNNGTMTEDANGNLSSDFEWVIDNRYALAWISGATDVDPQKKSTDLSGNYTLTFTGQATLSVDNAGDPAHSSISISNQSYDAGSNTTTATVTLGNPAGGLVGGIQFTNTKRSASDNPGDGVTNLHLWRPGYTSSANPIFTDLWLNSIKNYNWNALRFMGALGTNDYAQPSSAEVYPYRLQWATDRLQPSKGPAYAYNHVGVHGAISWEEVVIIAQLTHKDIWINIPVNASDDYVTQLANLLKNGDSYTNNQGIPDDVNVYVEYSNEMWHYGFPQGAWNNQAAKDEVAAGSSNLNYDNCNNNNDQWRFRRMAKRTIEIGNQIKSAFNDNGTRIRPVINNAFVGNDPDMLKYVNDNYGAPSKVLYGIAQTGYYTSTDRSSVQSILNTLKTSSDSNVNGYRESRAIATYYGLHSLTYEAGEGDTQQNANGNGTETDQELYNQFAASRDPGMQDVEMHDLNNWYTSGGDLYMQFSQVGRYSIYGFWGLSDDLAIQNSGKWNGMIQALNTAKPAFNAGNAVTASGSTSIDATKDVFGNGFGRPGTGSEAYFLLNVAQAGTYDVKITTNGSGPDNGGMGQATVSINNQQLGGVTNMPPSSTIDFGNVQLQAGPNTLRIYSVHGSFDPAYPNDVFHDQWQPVNAILTPKGGGGSGLTSGTTYSFKNQSVGKCFDNEGSTNANGTGIWIWDCSDSNQNQAWTVSSVGNGYYQLVVKSSGKCLDNTNGDATNGTHLQQWDCVGNQNQAWKFVSLGNGYYQIVNQATGKCVDNNAGGSNNGNIVQIWDCISGNQNQSWFAKAL